MIFVAADNQCATFAVMIDQTGPTRLNTQSLNGLLKICYTEP